MDIIFLFAWNSISHLYAMILYIGLTWAMPETSAQSNQQTEPNKHDFIQNWTIFFKKFAKILH